MQDRIISPSDVWWARMKHRDEEDKKSHFRTKCTADPALGWKIRGGFHCYMSLSRKIPQVSSVGVRTNVIKLVRSQNFTIELQLLWHWPLWKQWTKWGLRNSVKGMCFDNKALNTGVKGGVCVLLESKIGWYLLNLACCHHIRNNAEKNILSARCVEVSKNENLQPPQRLMA